MALGIPEKSRGSCAIARFWVPASRMDMRYERARLELSSDTSEVFAGHALQSIFQQL